MQWDRCNSRFRNLTPGGEGEGEEEEAAGEDGEEDEGYADEDECEEGEVDREDNDGNLRRTPDLGMSARLSWRVVS